MIWVLIPQLKSSVIYIIKHKWKFEKNNYNEKAYKSRTEHWTKQKLKIPNSFFKLSSKLNKNQNKNN